MFFLNFQKRNPLQESPEAAQILPVGGERVLRQPVFQPQRVAERIDERRIRAAQDLSSNASALDSCISSQRLASRR